MKVFLSWSGPHSRQVAMSLREWLPQVLQSIDPFVSSEDIDKGARWGADISTQLSDTNFGIVCLTPTNVGSPWINFEAGALSKTPSIGRVVPFLHGLKKTDVPPPLGLFQATSTDKEDIFLLLKTLNESSEPTLPEGRLLSAFDVWWPRLEKSLAAIPVTLGTPAGPATPQSSETGERPDTVMRSNTAMLEEVLSLVRGLTRTTSRANVPEARKWPSDGDSADKDVLLREVRSRLSFFGVRVLSYVREEARALFTINAVIVDTVDADELLTDLDGLSNKYAVKLSLVQPDGHVLNLPRRTQG